MARTITVKGVGRVSARPDYVVLSLTLESKDMEYGRAMELAAGSMDRLNGALAAVGFEKEAVKTTGFHVRTDYESERDKNGNYKSVFRGYAVVHDLKVAFNFDMERLGQTLSAISGCLADPRLSVAFTLKDPAAVNEELLRSAAQNARSKAEVLCAAAGVKLGELVSIDYNWGELNLYSHTSYEVEEDCAAPLMAMRAVEIEPEDIHVSDSAAFVWEIV